MDKVASLIKENEVGRSRALNSLLTVNAYAALQSIDSQLDSKRSTLSSLLTTVRFEVRALSRYYRTIANDSTKLAATSLMVNKIILDLLGKVLALPDYRGIIFEMDPFDVELLLDLTFYVRALSFLLFIIIAHSL